MSKSHSFTIAPLFKLLKAPANAQMKGNVTQQFLLWCLVTWHFSRDWAVLCSLHRPSADFFFSKERTNPQAKWSSFSLLAATQRNTDFSPIGISQNHVERLQCGDSVGASQRLPA